MSTNVFKTGRQAIEALPRSLRVGPFDFGIEKLSALRAIGPILSMEGARAIAP